MKLKESAQFAAKYLLSRLLIVFIAQQSVACSKVAYKRKKDAEKKEALFVAYAQNVPDIREYLTAKQVVALYGIERSTLYRLARLGKIPCINLGERLTRFKRSELDLLFHYRKRFDKRTSSQDKEII